MAADAPWQHPASAAGRQRQAGADGHDRAQLVRRLERLDAHPGVAVAHVELHATPRSARGASASAGRAAAHTGTASAASWPRPIRRSPRQKRPSSSRRTRPWASSATASRWAVARRQAGGVHQLGQRARRRLHGAPAPPSPCRARRRRLHCPYSEIIVSPCETVKRTARWPRRSQREGLGPPRRAQRAAASPTCSTSISTSSTRSPARRPSTASASPAGGVRRPDLTVATADHNVPTEDIDQPVADPISAKQLEVLAANTAEFGITHYGMGDPNQGIVHVIGPEQGRTLPGHDDRVRRQPHLHPRRLRGARLRHRHERGRARARHPDAPPGAARHDGRHRRRRAARRAPPPRT